MSFIAELWIPIVASTVLIFVASSIIHMVIKWHYTDYRAFSNEDAMRATVRAANPTPGQYVIPYCTDMKDLQKPEMQQKFIEGPIAFVTVRPSGPPKMGGALGMWFAFILAVCLITAYVASRTIPEGASALHVARLVGALSFLAYGAGSIQMGIWMGKPWPVVMKDLIDAVIHAAIAGAIFGWLWPR